MQLPTAGATEPNAAPPSNALSVHVAVLDVPVHVPVITVVWSQVATTVLIALAGKPEPKLVHIGSVVGAGVGVDELPLHENSSLTRPLAVVTARTHSSVEPQSHAPATQLVAGIVQALMMGGCVERPLMKCRRETVQNVLPDDAAGHVPV